MRRWSKRSARGVGVGFEVRESGKIYSAGALVIDNSVAMRWLVGSGEPADREYALAVRDFVLENRSHVLAPQLWAYEAANVAAYYVRAGELEYNVAVDSLRALQNLFTVRIDRDETPQALFEAAEAQGVSAYDASYLLLAHDEGLPLATLDKKMRKVAKDMKILLFAVPQTGHGGTAG